MEYTDNELDISEWVVVGTTNNTRFLGRLVNGVSISQIHEALLGRTVLELNPALDFIAPIQPKGEGFQRKPLVMPMDFVLQGVRVFIRPVFVYLCADMHESDRNAYKSFVLQAVELAQHATQERDSGGESGGTEQH